MRKSMKKHAKLVAAVTLAASMIAVPSVFALNSAGDGTGNGNKPFSITGYKYDDKGSGTADTLELFFNKDVSSPSESYNAAAWDKLITVTGGVENPTYSVTTVNTNGNYDGSSFYSKGTQVILTFGGDLDEDTEYTVTIDKLAMDKNGLTLGNYTDRQNLEFRFRTPTAQGGTTYTGNPYVTYVVGDPTDVSSSVYQRVSWESDLTVIFDRPMYSTQVSTYKTGLNGGYEKYNSGTSSWDDVALSDSAGSYEAYYAKSNDTNTVNTVFFFPETCNTSTTPVFNRTNSANQYRLTLPTDFYDVANRHTTAYSGMGSTFYFNTVSADYPGWENNGNPNVPLTVTSSAANTLYVEWTPSTINNAPADKSYYQVWYTTGDKTTGTYAQFTANKTYGTNGTKYTCTITGVPAGSYFVRLVPTNDGTSETTGEGAGFSIANSTAVTVSN